MKNWYNNKEILITGGTGSLGKTLFKQLSDMQTLHPDYLNKKIGPKGIRIYSRDELKQWNMQEEIFKGVPAAYILGDVRDYRRLKEAMRGVDLVIHTAALKQVPAAENNPLEYIQTNVYGTENVMRACIEMNVKRAVLASTDKAVEPINLYGASKMCAERVWRKGGIYSGYHRTKFITFRYGNIIGSRGSITNLVDGLKENEKIPVTDPAMTRFWTTLPKIGKFILDILPDTISGHVYIPQMVSSRLDTFLVALTGTGPSEWKRIGPRLGEKFHECLVNSEEYNSMWVNEKYFEIAGSHRPLEEGTKKLTSLNNPLLTDDLKVLHELMEGDL